MGLTGIMLWAKVWVGDLLARWWVDVATAVHFYEAILATLAIVVWHFYQVFFDPDVYPMNWAWWDGKMPVEHYRHEHELDNELDHEPNQDPGAKPRRSRQLLLTGEVAAAILQSRHSRVHSVIRAHPVSLGRNVQDALHLPQRARLVGSGKG